MDHSFILRGTYVGDCDTFHFFLCVRNVNVNIDLAGAGWGLPPNREELQGADKTAQQVKHLPGKPDNLRPMSGRRGLTLPVGC